MTEVVSAPRVAWMVHLHLLTADESRTLCGLTPDPADVYAPGLGLRYWRDFTDQRCGGCGRRAAREERR